jgi:hypothetical protein
LIFSFTPPVISDIMAKTNVKKTPYEYKFKNAFFKPAPGMHMSASVCLSEIH